MKSFRLSALVASLLVVATTVPSLRADDEAKRRNVTVSFGAGLNTVGSANHHIVPNNIEIKKGTVVNFVVAGFHQIFVYNPGTTPDDITAFIVANNLQTALFINKLDNLMYTGINPLRPAAAGAPGSFPTVNGSVVNGNDAIPPGNPVRVGFQNRVESVAFNDQGTFLVICNVRPHFQDPVNPMFAWIQVEDDD